MFHVFIVLVVKLDKRRGKPKTPINQIKRSQGFLLLIQAMSLRSV